MALELKRLKRTKIVQNMLENTSSLRGFLSVEPTTEQIKALDLSQEFIKTTKMTF